MKSIRAPSNESRLSATAPGCSSDRCRERPLRTGPRRPPGPGRGCAAPPAAAGPLLRGNPGPEPRPKWAAAVRHRGWAGRRGGSPAPPRGEGGWGRPLASGTLAGRGTPWRAGRGLRGCSAAAFSRRAPRSLPTSLPPPAPSGATLPERPSVPSPPPPPSPAVSPGPAGGCAEGRGRQSAAPLEVRGQPQLPPLPSLPPRPDTLVALFLPSEAGLSLPPRFPSCGPIPPAAAVTSPPGAACEGRRRSEPGAALPPPPPYGECLPNLLLDRFNRY